jgi:Cu2+-exporting ATPase
MSGADLGACFHCGLPAPLNSPWKVTIDGRLQPMCCPGCAAVAESIVACGFSDYYMTRKEFSATAAQAALVPPELQLYDEAEATAPAAGEEAEATFSIDGIRCAACVWLIERRLARLPGVQGIDLNVATERLHVRWNRAQCKTSDLLRSLREIGYAAYPYDPVRHGEQLEGARKTLFRQCFIAGLSMMQVMMYALPVYLANDGTMDASMTTLMRWAGLLLTLPAVVYSARPFFSGAWRNLQQRMPGMDVPVALGIAAAFGASVVATVSGQGEVYFDSVTMFIFLLLGSRYLELVARRKAASALDQLQHALPASASRMLAYPASRDTALVAAAQLQPGDIILVKPGEVLPADGTILEGDTSVDVALLTGESAPLHKAVGASVPGGAVNVTQPIVLRVTRVAGDSTLALLVKLIERAGLGKPQLALWADQVAAWFVAALLVFTVVVFFAWQWFDPSRAWAVAIAVLVVSCPCALSLATPTALAAATDRLIRQGALIVQPHVLETLARATHVIFDKTGTLTAGKPVLRDIGLLGALPRAMCLQIAAALEASSAHPLATAILAAAQAEPSASLLAASAVHSLAGQGIEGSVHGDTYRFGSAAFVEALTLTPRPAMSHPADGMTPVYLGSRDGWLARFDLADTLRGDAAQVVRYFQVQGKTVILLSGDQNAVTRRVADELHIETALGECLPEQKLTYVQGLQAQGAVVAMVGDGINDAAVLSAADVSFAMGSGTALAQMHADCVLLSGRLTALVDVAEGATQTMTVIRQNLAWATVYNFVAIPAAAFGLLNPWLSGIGMSLSSAVVVLNALRLRRIKRCQLTVAGEGVAIPVLKG